MPLTQAVMLYTAHTQMVASSYQICRLSLHSRHHNVTSITIAHKNKHPKQLRLFTHLAKNAYKPFHISSDLSRV